MPYRLSEKADEDVTQLYRHGFVQFGEAQADRYLTSLHEAFERIASFPRMGERLSKGFRKFVHRPHIVVYLVEDDGGVMIERVVDSRSNWRELLG